MEKICKLIHFYGCFVVEAPGHGRGLAFLWKNEGGVALKVVVITISTLELYVSRLIDGGTHGFMSV